MENIKDYKFFSGGAKGADSEWEVQLKAIGGNIIIYRPFHIDKLTSEQFITLNEQYLEVVNVLKRTQLSAETFVGKLVRRDMLQVKDAKSVYAIATLGNNGYVNGGTGYATTRAILMGLNVYLFEQEKEKWLKWDYNYQKFVEWILPLLDKNGSCCVGTRNLNSAGKQAIKDVIDFTFFNKTKMLF